jgi:hypothetical protein
MMEVILTAFRQMLLFAAALGLMVPALHSSASAQQTDREKAWATCLAMVDKARPRTASGDNEAERVAAFKACMAKLGIKP